MPLNVPDNYVEQFNANTFMLAQQKGSRLLAACERETLQGEVGFVDWTGQVELQERLALYEDTKFTPVPLGRRRYVGRDYEGSDIIDDVSKVRMIADPASRLTRAFAAGQGRKIDDVIIEEFFAPAWAGKQDRGRFRRDGIGDARVAHGREAAPRQAAARQGRGRHRAR
jgi:hypothetical protein